MATAKTTGSYLDPPQLHGVLNSNGTYTLSALELKALNDFNYYVAKMMQGGLNLANLNKATNQVFEDIEGNVTAVIVTAEGLTTYVSNLDNEVSIVKQTAEDITSEVGSIKDTTVTLTGDVSGLNTDISLLTTEVSTVKQTASSLSSTVTQVQQTANSASGTASSAYSKAQSVELTVDGFTVSDGYGNTTINGDKIRSGTIEGVTLVSKGTSAIVINEGTLSIWSDNPETNPYAARYSDIGYYNGEGKVFIESNGVPLKIDAGTNMSIDSGGTIFIGTNTARSGNVSIGQVGGNVNIVGNVTVNGTPIGG